MGFRHGMILFITSGIMFFVAFFWTFFHSNLPPMEEMGGFSGFKVFSFYAEWRAAHYMLLITILLAVFCATRV